MLTVEVYDRPGGHLLRKEKREPVCGEDFCDSCGDCLACHWGDWCPGRLCHRWIEYAEARRDLR